MTFRDSLVSVLALDLRLQTHIIQHAYIVPSDVSSFGAKMQRFNLAFFLPSLWVRESHILETISSGWREESPSFYVLDACNTSHYCDSNHDTTNVTLTVMTLTEHGNSRTHTQYISLRSWKMSALTQMCSAMCCCIHLLYSYWLLTSLESD